MGVYGSRRGLVYLLLAFSMVSLVAGQSEDSQDEGEIEAGPAEAGEAAEEEKWYDRIEPRLDLRLRYDGQWQEGSFDEGQRHRARYRLRAGLESEVHDRVRLGFELRSGDPNDPVSNNVTLGDGFSGDDFSIAEAFAVFSAGERVEIIGGKFEPGHWWEVSNLAWDDDVTVEGLMEDLVLMESSGPFSSLEATLYQYALDQSSSSGDAYLLGAQLRAGFDLGGGSRLLAGAGYDDFRRPQRLVDARLSGELRGNRVTNLLDEEDRLISDFDIGNLFVVWERDAPRWPLELSLFAYRNFGAEGIGKRYDSSLFARVAVGDDDRLGRVQLRLTYYDSEPDGLLFAFLQSDTDGASDLESSRLDVRVGFFGRSSWNFSWYHTDSKVAERETMDRIFVDYAVRF